MIEMKKILFPSEGMALVIMSTHGCKGRSTPSLGA